MKLAPSVITWLYVAVWSQVLDFLWPLHKTVDMKQFIMYLDLRKNCAFTVCIMVVYASFHTYGSKLYHVQGLSSEVQSRIQSIFNL